MANVWRHFAQDGSSFRREHTIRSQIHIQRHREPYAYRLEIEQTIAIRTQSCDEGWDVFSTTNAHPCGRQQAQPARVFFDSRAV